MSNIVFMFSAVDFIDVAAIGSHSNDHLCTVLIAAKGMEGIQATIEFTLHAGPTATVTNTAHKIFSFRVEIT